MVLKPAVALISALSCSGMIVTDTSVSYVVVGGMRDNRFPGSDPWRSKRMRGTGNYPIRVFLWEQTHLPLY
jgi:hypothetical protein